MKNKTGILLVNLGTPKACTLKAIRSYLNEFLMDSRVIDIPSFFRSILVKGLIVPFRSFNTYKMYRSIWTDEGSPLLVYGNQLTKGLNDLLGDEFHVELAMRYQEPGIKQGLNRLRSKNVAHIIVVPLFPQYASATVGSIYEKVMKEIKSWQAYSKLSFINQFFDHSSFISSYVRLAKDYDLSFYDHILFSFHGLPIRQIKKADTNNFCLGTKDCCQKNDERNQFCYSAQCHKTTKILVDSLGLTKEQYSICFQSRLGSDPWLEPYFNDVLKEMIQKKKKKILVFCPAFVSDCLETIFEIEGEYQSQFKKMGGDTLDLVKGLNANSFWIKALKEICLENAVG